MSFIVPWPLSFMVPWPLSFMVPWPLSCCSNINYNLGAKIYKLSRESVGRSFSTLEIDRWDIK